MLTQERNQGKTHCGNRTKLQIEPLLEISKVEGKNDDQGTLENEYGRPTSEG